MQKLKFALLPVAAYSCYKLTSIAQAEEEKNPLFDDVSFPEFTLDISDQPPHIKNKYNFPLPS